MTQSRAQPWKGDIDGLGDKIVCLYTDTGKKRLDYNAGWDDAPDCEWFEKHRTQLEDFQTDCQALNYTWLDFTKALVAKMHQIDSTVTGCAAKKKTCRGGKHDTTDSFSTRPTWMV